MNTGEGGWGGVFGGTTQLSKKLTLHSRRRCFPKQAWFQSVCVVWDETQDLLALVVRQQNAPPRASCVWQRTSRTDLGFCSNWIALTSGKNSANFWCTVWDARRVYPKVPKKRRNSPLKKTTNAQKVEKNSTIRTHIHRVYSRINSHNKTTNHRRSKFH